VNFNILGNLSQSQAVRGLNPSMFRHGQAPRSEEKRNINDGIDETNPLENNNEEVKRDENNEDQSLEKKRL
jgi:hypothetical protein